MFDGCLVNPAPHGFDTPGVSRPHPICPQSLRQVAWERPTAALFTTAGLLLAF
jgi:hypothetical protein